MKLVNTNDENSFDPTPKLKSSPIPILFLTFDDRYIDSKSRCFYCGNTLVLFFLAKNIAKNVYRDILPK